MLDNLIIKNNSLINKYTLSGETDKLFRQNLIKKLLLDKKLFFKIDIEDAYNILNDLEYSMEEVRKIYKELIKHSLFSE